MARTLLDFASVTSLERTRNAVAEADFRRLLELDQSDAITGPGRAGSARLNRALSLHRPEYARTKSPREDVLLDLCRHHRIPFPEMNVKLGPYEVDALWRDERLIVEVDGGEGHGTIAQMRRDRERDLWLRAAGFTVHRYSGVQLTSDRRAVATDIRRALRERFAPSGRTGRRRGYPLS